MIKSMIAVFVLLLSQMANAEPITLNCINTGMEKGNEYVVDIEKRQVVSLFRKFDIVHVDKDYITAVHVPSKKASYTTNLKPFPLGGTLWALNRITGEFEYAWIGLGTRRGESTDNMKLTSDSFGGVCAKKIL